MIKINRSIVILLLTIVSCITMLTASAADSTAVQRVMAYMEKTLPGSKIPGLSLVFIADGKPVILNYGYADVQTNEKVNSKTLFQLASCSKAFTAMGITLLERQGRLNLDDKVSRYIPWLTVTYKDTLTSITLRQLLHHTSGIPWSTMMKIPSSDNPNALEETIKKLKGQELDKLPGTHYEYATINYDILALVIQYVSGQSFESFIQDNVLSKLQLNYTTVGSPADSNLLATGYKIGFFKARKYEAPVYKGNNAGGYIYSNAADMSRWLQFQMGTGDSSLLSLARETHQRDETVFPYDMASYAGGWQVSLRGDGEIYHSGLNPNFTAFVGFRPNKQIGVVVLANSNSGYTEFIGSNILKLLAGDEINKEFLPYDGSDRSYSIVTFIITGYILFVMALLGRVIYNIKKGKRTRERLSAAKVRKFLLSLIILLPFLYGLYKLPAAMAGFTWGPTLVWSPVSFAAMVIAILGALFISYLSGFISLLYPETNKFKKLAPKILLASILSGLANMIVILLVTSALNSNIKLKYLLFYYGLILSVYLFTRRFVQMNLIRFTNDLIYELRVSLIGKIFATSYQQFEQIDHGRVYTTLNDDVETIGESTNMVVMLIISFFTIMGAFLYLATIAFWATIVTTLLILSLSSVYYFVSKSTNKYFVAARNNREVFIGLINGMIDGFKEIGLRRAKRTHYKEDVAACADEYRSRISLANIRFVNASLVGESLLILVLGIVAFGIKEFFPAVQTYTIMSFVIVLLYLIGPLNTILNAVPSVLRIRISWKRVQSFLKEIPAHIENNDLKTFPKVPVLDSIRAEGLKFRYKKEGEENAFAVGPIDLEVKSGEILFIIGGNGSGKTTLSKLLTGLYEPDQGRLLINGEVISSSQIGENFSTVFSPVYLFQKLYDTNVSGREEEVKRYLELLHLEDKVEIKDNAYTTINLSGGQRKRLALLQCYLEDSPVFLFDEWAADQDPEYRNFFYRTLLPEMKRLGKIVIAITHDDHYFDVADKVLKMKNGKLEIYSSDTFNPKNILDKKFVAQEL